MPDAPPANQTTLAIPIVYRDFLPLDMDGGHIDSTTRLNPRKASSPTTLAPTTSPSMALRRASTTHGAAAFDQ
jgi:hypothetical protein